VKNYKYILVLSILFLFTGCANKQSIGVTYNTKYKNKITDSAFIWTEKGTRLKYRDTGTKGILNKCKNESKKLYRYLSSNHSIDDDFRARDIEIKYLNSPVKVLVNISPIEYYSADVTSCKPTSLKFGVILSDIDEISKNWKGRLDRKKLKKLSNIPDEKTIWRGTFNINFSENKALDYNNKDFDNLRKIVITELEKSGLLLPYVRTIKDAKNLRKDEISRINKKKKLSKDKLSRSKTLNLLESIDCSKIKDRLGHGYGKNSKALCIGNLSFTNAKVKSKSQKLSMLNATTSRTVYKLENSTCPMIVASEDSGSKQDDSVDFKHTYKDQLLKVYNKNCQIDNIDGINFLTCKKDGKKDYFLELSFINDNRIYKKNMLQMGKMCFDRFKRHFNKDNLGTIWRTKYGFNKDGWNYIGENILTDFSMYDKDGYDYDGWNKDGINKYTKSKYDKNGFSLSGSNIHGIDKDGWSSKLKKFVKIKDKNDVLPFEILELKTLLKNKIYNREFYDNLIYEKTKDGFYMVGKKIYGSKKKPEKIEKYYFRSAKSKLLDLDNPNKSIMKERLVLEKKIVRTFDKNGYDKDGFDKNDWHGKLKKFRSQL